jgi:hypothetical protein
MLSNVATISILLLCQGRFKVNKGFNLLILDGLLALGI